MKQIKKYQIVEQLEKNFSSTIYLARHRDKDTPVVIKILNTQKSPQITELLKKQIKRYSSLRHPNIVSILDYGIHENRIFLVVEYVDGKTLRQIFDRRKNILTYSRKKSPILYRWGMNCENKVFSDCW